MKKLLLPLLALLVAVLPVQAVDEITAVITITNVPAGLGTNLTVNAGIADTRYHTNNVAGVEATHIPTTNSIGWAKTNLLTHLVNYPVYAGTVALSTSYNSTNSAAINITAPLGSNITVSFNGNWAYVTYVTQVFGLAPPILTSTNRMSPGARTNAENAIINLLGQNQGSNSIPLNVVALRKYADTNTPQVVANKTLVNPVINGGRITEVTNLTGSNVLVTNVVIHLANITGVDLAGFVTALTNGTFWSNVLQYARITNAVGLHAAVQALQGGYWTNGTLIIPTLLSPGISNGTLFGATTITGAVVSMVGSGVNNLISMTATTTVAAVGAILVLDRENGITNAVDAGDVLGIIGFRGYGTTGQKTGARIRAIPIETFTDSTAGSILLFETTPSGTVQPVGRLHIGSDGLVTISNMLQVVVALTNSIFSGTNKWKGDLSFDRYSNTSMVNGKNEGILIGTNVVVELSGATTIAQYAGMVAARDGDTRVVRMSGAVTNIIVNEVDATWGTDATAANRFVTGTGASLYLTNQPSWFKAMYRGASSRWEILDHSR